MAGLLLLTDGTIQVELKDGPIKLMDWTPAIPSPKNGGIWRDSPLADGRQMAFRRFDHVTDTFNLAIETDTMDDTIRASRNLRTLLEKAVSYWTAEWQNEPVWIAARGSCETETRYALVYDYRTPNDADPYKPPFHNVPATTDSFILLLEHGPWLANPPGVGECTSISAQSASEFPYYLLFAGGVTADRVNCLSAAALDDRPAAAAGFTAEAWVRPDGQGGGGSARIYEKGGANGWYLRIEGTGRITGYIAAPTPANSISNNNFLIADGTWKHVAMTYDNVGARVIRLWVNGTEVTYNTQTAAVGVLTSDAAASLIIGNESTGAWNRAWEGGIGWCRISPLIRYAAGFTVPPRCVLPNTVATTGLWICEGTGATAYNKVGTAGTDGTITGAVWGSACGELYGREAVCAVVGTTDTAYVSNRRGGQLTHVMNYDASAATYSVNLLASALPYNLFPAVMQAAGAGNEDMLYFGSDTTGLQGGPFCNLVFNVGTAANTIVTDAWEYWNGAWVAIPAVTASVGDLLFATTGTMVVIFDPPAGWITTAIAGCTGYFVRCRLTAVGGGAASPTEATRDVYTGNSPFYQLSDTAISGDIPALAAGQMYEYGLAVGATHLRFVWGSRHVDRGADFTAYINLADIGNPYGITVTRSTATTSFATSPQAVAGRYVLYAPAGIEALASRINIDFASTIAYQYYGKYRVFLRADCAGGGVTDFAARFSLIIGGVTILQTGSTRVITNTGSTMLRPELTDLGILAFLPNSSRVIGNIDLSLELSCSSGAPGTLSLIDLVLIPIDESPIDINNAFGDYLYYQFVDSISNPKMLMDCGSINRTTGLQLWQARFVGIPPFILSSGTRIWSLLIDSTQSRVNGLERTFSQKSDRYLSMRGTT